VASLIASFHTTHGRPIPFATGLKLARPELHVSVMDVRRLRRSIEESFAKTGFTFIEVLAPCPIGFGRRNELDEAAMGRMLVERCEIRHGADTREVAIAGEGPIVCGKFVDLERPSYLQMLEGMRQRLQERSA